MQDKTGTYKMEIEKSEALKDIMGNYWCSVCYKHRDLIDFGYKHKWPLVQTGGYAIGEGYELWRAIIGMGTDKCIDALWHGLIDATEA